MLGPTQSIICFRMPQSGIPLEQAVHWQRLRPGSGFLNVKVITDGPTRVLQVSDFLNKSSTLNPSASLPRILPADSIQETANPELQFEMRIKGGLGK